ncbi:MAG: hypothetical protein ACOX24_00335 [Christensenellales bacterium]
MNLEDLHSKAKTKLFRLLLGTFSSQIADIPTSTGVSDEVVKSTSPYLTSACLGSICYGFCPIFELQDYVNTFI